MREPSRDRIAVLQTSDSQGGLTSIHDGLKVGNLLLTSPPHNRFLLENAWAFVFFACGVGITPLVPMVEECERRGVRWWLMYGGRRRESMAFAEALIDRYGPTKVALVPEDEAGMINLADELRGYSMATLVAAWHTSELCADRGAVPHDNGAATRSGISRVSWTGEILP